jgi:DNA-binding MarR family transcriptional regulator
MVALDPHGEAFTEMVLEIFRLNRLLLDAGDELTAPVGLTSARWQVLGVIEHAPLPVARVARVIGLTRQSVQTAANGLAANGFVTFTDNPHHQRARLITLTPRGRQALDYVQARQAGWANAQGGGHALARLRAAVKVLRQARQRLDPEAPPAPGAGQKGHT